MYLNDAEQGVGNFRSQAAFGLRHRWTGEALTPAPASPGRFGAHSSIGPTLHVLISKDHRRGIGKALAMPATMGTSDRLHALRRALQVEDEDAA